MCARSADLAKSPGGPEKQKAQEILREDFFVNGWTRYRKFLREAQTFYRSHGEQTGAEDCESRRDAGALPGAGEGGNAHSFICAAIGAWIGPGQLFIALVLTGLVGGAMALIWAACGGFLKELFQHTSDLAFRKKERGEAVLSNPLRRKMPYAPAIAIGTLISFFAR